MVRSKLHLSGKPSEAKKHLLGAVCNISSLRKAAACPSDGFLWHRLDLPVWEKPTSGAKQPSRPSKWGCPLEEKSPVVQSCCSKLPSWGLSSTGSRMERESKAGEEVYVRYLQGPSALSEEPLGSHSFTRGLGCYCAKWWHVPIRSYNFTMVPSYKQWLPVITLLPEVSSWKLCFRPSQHQSSATLSQCLCFREIHLWVRRAKVQGWIHYAADLQDAAKPQAHAQILPPCTHWSHLHSSVVCGGDCTHVGVSIPPPIHVPPALLFLSMQGRLRVLAVARLGTKICAEVRVQVLWSSLRLVLHEDPPQNLAAILTVCSREWGLLEKYCTSHSGLWIHSL